MTESEKMDLLYSTGIQGQQRAMKVAYEGGKSMNWANIVTNTIHKRHWWDISGPLAAKSWALMVEDIKGAVSETCPDIEFYQSSLHIEAFPLKEARWKNIILFMKALEILGIEHKFSPEFIKVLVLYKLEQE